MIFPWLTQKPLYLVGNLPTFTLMAVYTLLYPMSVPWKLPKKGGANGIPGRMKERVGMGW
jgi:hypothetical protein